MTKCFACSPPPTDYRLVRKSIDISGRLGSLYDASNDNFVDQYDIEPSKRKTPERRYISEIYTGVQLTEKFRLLKEIGFDDGLRLSILLQMVTPSGVCRVIDYNQIINPNTRFLYYSYRNRIDKLNIKARKADQIVPPPKNSSHATHMITEILWGIEFLFVIQIPKGQLGNTIDELLRRISKRLKNNQIPIQFNTDDQRLINQLTDTTIFGSELYIENFNIPILTILNRLQDWQNNINFHHPLIYIMQPLRWLYNNKQFSETVSWPYENDPHLCRIEPILIRIKNQIRDLQQMLINIPINFKSHTLNIQSNDEHQQFQYILNTQEHLQERLKNILIDIRRHREKSKIIDDIMSDQRYTCLHKIELETYSIRIERLYKKTILIRELGENGIQYINVFDIRSNGEIPITIEDIDTILKHSFKNENRSTILWYSSDRLKREQTNRWEDIYQQLLTERQQITYPITSIYADFTNCKPQLKGFAIIRLPSTKISDIQHDPINKIVPRIPHTRSVPSTPIPQSKFLPPLSKPTRRSLTPPPISISPPIRPSPPPPPIPPRPSSPKIDINVLLLGETGVGKSTFINAFVNYLKFDTLQQAEDGEPVVLIPVSFLITTGDEFDEFIVKFGNTDLNENYEHQGQSVTQQCRSYIFDLNDRIRLRLIDTPGIGDTRGINQDIKNINHILTYIDSLSHINAICLLLKPNASRLNIFFRSCINQLLTYITPIGYNNIIFCFTNARSTFYAPGDTGPLLRKMLNDEQLNDIPFKKENTFCFDSESFRYLSAKKSKINFDNDQKQEYINSWNISVKESIRLINFIQTLKLYKLNEYISPRKATLDISILARPLMETLRLIIYNWKLNESKLFFNQINLNSKPINIDLCTHCAQINIADIGPYWLTQYQPILLKNKIDQHQLCSLDNKHFLIESIIQHEFNDKPAGLKNERWQSSFQNFLFKCDKLIHFLRQQGPFIQYDPFDSIIERFIEEEKDISQIRNIDTNMNRKIYEVLNSIKQIREQNSQQLFTLNEKLSLDQVYQIINEFIAIPTVNKQIESIKLSRQLKMKEQENKISINIINNRTFT